MTAPRAEIYLLAMELIFAYGAGLLTLINPCVLPILPMLLASSLQTSRHGPLAVAAGMSVSFVTLGLLVTVAGRSLGISENTISNAGAVVMIGFGLILLVPQLSGRFATATAGMASGVDTRIDQFDQGGLGGQFAIGALIGAVWSPCIGPTLGAAIGLASQGQSIAYAAAIMTFFAFGVSTIILGLGYGARAAILRRQSWMRSIAEKSRPILGGVFLLMGVAILFHWPRLVEAWAVGALPAWLIDLSVSL